MCGIAGFVSTDSQLKTLKRMTDRMSLRGPDGQGQWLSPPSGPWQAGLGHRRLSIIDLEGGAQPLSNEDGRIWISFNGEIFNFQELRLPLQRQGHAFRTRSDTEVIVHHYEEHGESGLASLNGMFALALWDQDRCRLVLARDRAGVKPLYYARLSDGGIAFASEMSALARHPGVSRGIPRESLAAYFFSDYVHAPGAMFEGVKKLEPGTFLVWEKGSLRDPEPFWSIPSLGPESLLPRRRDVPGLVSELREVLLKSVERQLISDVPVGVFLSGGIDSSLVAALAARASRAPVRTFSIAFEDRDFDESAYARKVARHLGTDHQEETLSERGLLDNLDAALDSLDEPMADPSILPTFMLSRLAARSVKVALGGDAGDELFAGYPTYRAYGFARYYRRVPAALRKNLVERMIARLPVRLGYQSFEWKAKRFALRWDNDPLRRHLRWLSATDLPDLQEIFPPGKGPGAAEPAVLGAAGGILAAGTEDVRAGHMLNALLGLDFRTYLPGSVLCKVDRASMGNSLEVRPPFLDNDVMDWAFALPGELKLRRGVSKFILKEAARPFLPEEIIFRRKKGFAIPLGRWLRGPLKGRLDSVLRDSPAWDLPYLSHECFARWAGQHADGTVDRSKPLWSLIVLDQWMRREAPHGA